MNLFKIKNRLIVFALTLFLADSLVADNLDFRGQLSGWLGGSRQVNQTNNQIGLRYLPEGTFSKYISDESFLETLVSLNMHASALNGDASHNLKLYRLQMRFTTSQSETRIGLQKISFGPAQLLRSLRWFDTLDPSDPLNMTEGAYALRYTYSFLNNANIWLWTLYGNQNIKGFEFNPSVKDKPEFGGRLQLPAPAGEIALTAHSREAQDSNFKYRENRAALDGRWDILIGLWFEAVTQNSASDSIALPWQKQLTLGTDFTFGIGNGLYASAEHMFASVSKTFSSNDKTVNTSAILISYPFGVFDSFRAISFYSWQTEKFYQYYSWQRTFDEFILNLSLFNYPSVQGLSGTLPLSGYGAQIMFIYNY